VRWVYVVFSNLERWLYVVFFYKLSAMSIRCVYDENLKIYTGVVKEILANNYR